MREARMSSSSIAAADSGDADGHAPPPAAPQQQLQRVSLHYCTDQIHTLLEAVYGERLSLQRLCAKGSWLLQRCNVVVALSPPQKQATNPLFFPPTPNKPARRVRVAPDTVGALMDMAGFLECPLLTGACCQYLRSALAPPSCVDVLLLAHQYHCAQLRREAVSGGGTDACTGRAGAHCV
jgi:hypothetical protein